MPRGYSLDQMLGQSQILMRSHHAFAFDRISKSAVQLKKNLEKFVQFLMKFTMQWNIRFFLDCTNQLMQIKWQKIWDKKALSIKAIIPSIHTLHGWWWFVFLKQCSFAYSNCVTCSTIITLFCINSLYY